MTRKRRIIRTKITEASGFTIEAESAVGNPVVAIEVLCGTCKRVVSRQNVDMSDAANCADVVKLAAIAADRDWIKSSRHRCMEN